MTHDLIVTDHRGRPIGTATLDEHPDRECTITVDGYTWVGLRRYLEHRGNTLRIRQPDPSYARQLTAASPMEDM